MESSLTAQGCAEKTRAAVERNQSYVIPDGSIKAYVALGIQQIVAQGTPNSQNLRNASER